MSLRFGVWSIGVAAVLASLSLASNDAHACGGCFHEPPDPVNPQSQATVVTGHRMALSVSMDRTVLWDQIQYAGDPEEFAWVLPVKPGAFLELANDAFFEALEAGTATTVSSPSIGCPQPDPSGGGQGFGDGDYAGSGCSTPFACGAAMAAGGPDYYEGGSGGGGGSEIVDPPDPVSVVHQASIGPYETVTIHSNVPGALYDWLDSHGYAVDESVKPIIDDYETEGFDFIALRLAPGNGVRLMQPVRVISPGASPVLPLRMVSAGTGANVAVTLFVIGEGRWETQNFPSTEIDPSQLVWDFSAQTSNYSELRTATLAANEGDNWLTSYARANSMLSLVQSYAAGGSWNHYVTAGGTQADTIAGLYMWQAMESGADVTADCASGIDQNRPYQYSEGKVVESCSTGSGGSGAGGSGTGAGGAGAGGAGAGGAGAGGAGAGGAGAGGAGAGGAGAGGSGAGGSGAGGSGAGGSGGPDCSIGPDEIDAASFACGSMDDVAVALVGMHPKDVWITRLEANLPHAALNRDLAMQAHANQWEREGMLIANGVANPPCADWVYTNGSTGSGGFVVLPGDGTVKTLPPRDPPAPPPALPRELFVAGLAFAALAAGAARRIARPALRPARSTR